MTSASKRMPFFWHCLSCAITIGLVLLLVVEGYYLNCARIARREFVESRPGSEEGHEFIFRGLRRGMSEQQVDALLITGESVPETSKKFRRIDPPRAGYTRWYRWHYGPQWRPLVFLGQLDYLAKEEYEVLFTDTGEVKDIIRRLSGRAILPSSDRSEVLSAE